MKAIERRRHCFF